MLTPRFVALLVVAAAGLAVVVGVALGRALGGDTMASVQAGASPQAAPATIPQGDPPVPGRSPAAPRATPAATSSAGALEAAAAAKRFCDLVDAGSLAAAGRLLAGPWVWPRAELRLVRRLRFVSAQVHEGALAGGLVLLVRARARLRGPSSLNDGVNTLFFTFGRDGTTGGWLVTAVTTSP